MNFKKNNNKKNILLFLFLLLLEAAAAGQSEGQKLTLGIAQFDTSGMSSELMNIGTLLPQQLLKKIFFFDTLELSRDALASLDDKSRSLELNRSKNKIAALRKERDALFFQALEPAQKNAAIDLKETEIKNIFRKIKDGNQSTLKKNTESLFLLNLHGELIAGKLLKPVESPRITSALYKADYLIYGKCWERKGYIGYTIFVFNAILQKEIFTATQYAALDDIDSSLDGLIRPIASSILDKPYSIVTLTFSPNDVTVSLDGKATSKKSILFLKNETHVLEISASGFISKKHDFTVATGEDSTIAIELELSKSENVTIESAPPGSQVYVNTEKIGVTPMVVERSSQNKIIRLEKEGFNSEQFVIGPSSKMPLPIIQMKLSNGKSHEENFDVAKDKFYRSLGLFIGVLPVSVFSYGTFKTYEQITAKIFDDFTANIITAEQQTSAALELNPKFYLSQTVFWTSLSASLLLAGNAIFRLILYIDAAN